MASAADGNLVLVTVCCFLCSSPSTLHDHKYESEPEFLNRPTIDLNGHCLVSLQTSYRLFLFNEEDGLNK